MLYPLIPDAFNHGLIPWLYIFGWLSIPQFDEVYEAIEFPLTPTPDLQKLAHDFLIGYNVNVEKLSRTSYDFDLFKNVLSVTPHYERHEMLFKNTFMYLEEMGYANSIYRWAMRTHKFYRYKDILQLNAWSNLLLDWSINEHMHDIELGRNISTSHLWELFISKYSLSRNLRPDQLPKAVETLPLTQTSNLTLRTVVLNHEIEYLNFSHVVERIFTSALSDWESFVLHTHGGYSWMKLEGLFQIHREEWTTIVDALSIDENNVLNEWGERHKHYYIDTALPQHLWK